MKKQDNKTIKLNIKQMELVASSGYFARKRYARAIKLRAKRQKLVRKIAKLENRIENNDLKLGAVSKDELLDKSMKDLGIKYEAIS